MNTIKLLREAIKKLECDNCMSSRNRIPFTILPYNNDVKNKQMPTIEIVDSIGGFGKIETPLNLIIDTKKHDISEVYCCLNQLKKIEVDGLKVSLDLGILTQQFAVGTSIMYQGTCYVRIERE